MPRHLAAVAILLPFAVMFLAPDVAQAAGEPNLIHITTTNDVLDAFDQQCSLREAVRNADTNSQYSPIVNECAAGSGDGTDVIVLQSGVTYLLTRPGNADDAGDLDLLDDVELAADIVDIRIESTGDAPATIRQTVPGQRVMKISYARAELSNLAILDGDTVGYGGGILAASDMLLLDRIVLSGNKANDGGGLAVEGNVTLVDCQIIFNEAPNGSGGGIWHTDGQLLIQGGLIQKNTSYFGGGGIVAQGNLTIENGAFITENEGSSGGGGGVVFVASTDHSLLIRNTKIENNQGGSGGGGIAIFGEGAVNVSAKIEDVEFRNNQAPGGAGGAISTNIDIEIVGSIFEENSAASFDGGAIQANRADIRNSSFIGNITGASGGAIWANDLVLNNCSFIKNIAGDNGGAMFADGSVTVNDSRFTLNQAADGGAIELGQSVNASRVIQRSSFVENSAANMGGGISTIASDLVIANTTLSGNTAGAAGGSGIAIAAFGANVSAVNVTLAGKGPSPTILKLGNLTLKNSIVFSPDAKNCEVAPNNPLLLSLGNNLVNDSSCLGVNSPSDQTGPGVEPMLAPLADNGGNTQTHALLDGSPAIDAGDGVACANAPVDGVDQRGVARTAGLNCDIGAFEKTIQSVELFKDGFE